MSARMPSPLLFLHIPRTGGTSLVSYMDTKFAPEEICPAREWFEFERLDREGRLGGYRFYRGHFGINLPDALAADCTIITFLRSPISRLFSAWRHMRGNSVPPLGKEEARSLGTELWTIRAARRLDFPNFCYFMMRNGHQQGFFNTMTTLLACGRGSDITEGTIWTDRRGCMERAKQAVDRFAFIGFTEIFDESVAGLQRQFAWEIQRIDQTNAAPPCDMRAEENFLDWLRAATSLDQELFDYTLQRAERFRKPVLKVV